MPNYLGSADWGAFSHAFARVFHDEAQMRRVYAVLDGGDSPWDLIRSGRSRDELLVSRPYHGSNHALGVYHAFVENTPGELQRSWVNKMRLFAVTHDAVLFRPGRFPPMSSEHASLEVMRWVAHASGAPWFARDLAEVTEAVMATALHTHDMPFLGGFAKAALDADLAGFADSYRQVEMNRDAIRRECADLSDDAWLPGRIAFLEALLRRERLYYFATHLEEFARENIAHELTDTRAALARLPA